MLVRLAVRTSEWPMTFITIAKFPVAPYGCFRFSIRVENQPPSPVDVLNPNANDLLGSHPCVLNHHEDVFRGLLCYRKQLRPGVRVDGQFPSDFLHQLDPRAPQQSLSAPPPCLTVFAMCEVPD